jgi:hypothetical protein
VYAGFSAIANHHFAEFAFQPLPAYLGVVPRLRPSNAAIKVRPMVRQERQADRWAVAEPPLDHVGEFRLSYREQTEIDDALP